MAGKPPVVVIGAGVVGVLTAYSLAKRGRSVTVIDRAPAPAELCSRANAGILAVGHAKAWAGPAARGSILRALAGREPGVAITRLMDIALWRWGAEFLRNCSARAHAANSAKLQRLSRYSRALTKRIEADLDLPSELRHDGGLYLFQNQAQFAAHSASLGKDGSHGMDGHGEDRAMKALPPEALSGKDPALAQLPMHLAGGLFSPLDSVGDCHAFTRRVAAALAERPGVSFRFGVNVTGFERHGARLDTVLTDQGPVQAEAVVLATGVDTPTLSRSLGVRPKIYPVKGYSGTWKILDDTRIPHLPFIDETALMAVASYGGRLRVTALAEFAGHDTSLPEARRKLLQDYVAGTFGDAVDLDRAEFWTGLRPSTPAGPPYLGRVRKIDNLWINAGHGQLGWTMAAGCAELLAARLTGDQTEIDTVSSTAPWLDAI
ncbi:FAD-dependent oxidoreductase [Celeribacter neptunius]|uniref:D-amino-acid dehydrogenase n=1 Tax=Celeribacter neptunius TaxID=588602 RepID=A0A1I3PN41_9RHOB|nr:FAD-dependent oxidoreductase [Celeribacter neptunius]SFJ23154.1 D-amino-acid dehydrogenase [Celeribacter neptunius]